MTTKDDIRKEVMNSSVYAVKRVLFAKFGRVFNTEVSRSLIDEAFCVDLIDVTIAKTLAAAIKVVDDRLWHYLLMEETMKDVLAKLKEMNSHV